MERVILSILFIVASVTIRHGLDKVGVTQRYIYIQEEKIVVSCEWKGAWGSCRHTPRSREWLESVSQFAAYIPLYLNK